MVSVGFDLDGVNLFLVIHRLAFPSPETIEYKQLCDAVRIPTPPKGSPLYSAALFVEKIKYGTALSVFVAFLLSSVQNVFCCVLL